MKLHFGSEIFLGNAPMGAYGAEGIAESDAEIGQILWTAQLTPLCKGLTHLPDDTPSHAKRLTTGSTVKVTGIPEHLCQLIGIRSEAFAVYARAKKLENDPFGHHVDGLIFMPTKTQTQVVVPFEYLPPNLQVEVIGMPSDDEQSLVECSRFRNPSSLRLVDSLAA